MKKPKDFKENPVWNFITKPKEGTDVPPAGQIPSPAPSPAPSPTPQAPVPTSPVRYKREPVEIKTRRVQIILQPGIYDKAKNEANRRGMSFNEYIHHLIKNSNI